MPAPNRVGFSSARAVQATPDLVKPDHGKIDTLMAHHRLSPWQYMILGMVSVCAPMGDSCLSRGMSRLPAITLAHPLSLIAAVFTPWIAMGILLLIGFFASYLTALSWADLTFVMPAAGLGNVVIALLSRYWLHETISIARWVGIVLITVGVGFVAQGPSLTEHPPAPVQAEQPELEEQLR